MLVLSCCFYCPRITLRLAAVLSTKIGKASPAEGTNPKASLKHNAPFDAAVQILVVPQILLQDIRNRGGVTGVPPFNTPVKAVGSH